MRPPIRTIPRMVADPQNAKGPAEAATSPSHGSNIPSEETKMNEAIDTTGEPVFARTPISVAAIHAEVEGLWSQSRDLQVMSNLLTGDLEQAFLISRGRQTADGTIVLMFQERHIDVTLWLVGKLWGEAEALEAKLSGLKDKLEALA